MAARFRSNTHGGLLSFAHSGIPGSLFHFHEVIAQLRGECGERQVPGRRARPCPQPRRRLCDECNNNSRHGEHAVIAPRRCTQASSGGRRRHRAFWAGLRRRKAAAAALRSIAARAILPAGAMPRVRQRESGASPGKRPRQGAFVQRRPSRARPRLQGRRPLRRAIWSSCGKVRG